MITRGIHKAVLSLWAAVIFASASSNHAVLAAPGFSNCNSATTGPPRSQTLVTAYGALSHSDYNTALDTVRPLIIHDPNDVTPRRYAGIALYHQGYVKEAVKNLGYCLALNPTEPTDYLYLGDSHFSSSNYRKAIDAYVQALQLNPRLTPAYTGLAKTYLAIGQLHYAELVRKRAREYGCVIQLPAAPPPASASLPTIRS